MKKLLFVLNVDWFFVSHRLPIALAAKDAGYDVYVMCESTGIDFSKYGINKINVPFGRSNQGIFSNLTSVILIYRHIKQLKPDLIHAITIKPIFLVSSLFFFTNSFNRFVISFSGLGPVFMPGGIINFFRNSVFKLLLKILLSRKPFFCIFQNQNDIDIISRCLGKKPKHVLIPGSGVDLNRYNNIPLADDQPINILFASRLLKSKGLLVLVEACESLYGSFPDFVLTIAGSVDLGSVDSITPKELELITKKPYVRYLGHVNDMASVIKDSCIVVLPSWYAEGLPKILVEAAASSRCVVTTDHPGCRDAIIPNVTGVLVPPKSSSELCSAIEFLLKRPELIKGYGIAGRLHAEATFSISQVIHTHLRIYSEMT